MNSDIEVARTIVGVPVTIRLRAGFLGLAVLGGALGTVARFALVEATPAWQTLSLGTVLVNVVGPLGLGVLIGALGYGTETRRRRAMRLLLGVGFFGALTSYAQLAVDIVVVTEHHHVLLAAGYAAATILTGGLAAWTGLVTGASWGRRRAARDRARAARS